MIQVVRKGHRTVNASWAKLIRMDKKQREAMFLKADQEELAREHADLIAAAKAERKRLHIANMVAVAARKKRR